MKTKYFLYGGQVAAPAYRWKGYTLPGLTRVAADTRGLSGMAGADPEMEYLPYRASGPEPLDPGELGDAGDGLGNFANDLVFGSVFGVPYPALAVVGLVGYLLLRKKRA